MIDTPTAAALMTPALYMQKRREAAGLEVDDVAIMIGEDVGGYAAAVEQLRKLEAGEDMPAEDLKSLLRILAIEAFSFDPYLYERLQLRAEDPTTPVPPICRGCACSWHDACRTPAGPCAWAETGEQSLCTACAERLDREELEQSAMSIGVVPEETDACPDCGGPLGPTFGRRGSRTCGACDVTFMGAGPAQIQEGGHAA